MRVRFGLSRILSNVFCDRTASIDGVFKIHNRDQQTIIDVTWLSGIHYNSPSRNEILWKRIVLYYFITFLVLFMDTSSLPVLDDSH
jgi:hypothetical protein